MASVEYNVTSSRDTRGEEPAAEAETNVSLKPLISVIIPVFNEVTWVADIVRQVRDAPFPMEIIIVDDGSTDGTGHVLDTLAESDTVILRHDRNQGKGAALRTALAHINGNIVLVQDADLEYDPADYARLIQPLIRGRADVVYGSRFLHSDSRLVLNFWHCLANRLVTVLSNAFTGLNLSDMETCYKVFNRDVIDMLKPTLKESGFGIEPELTAKIARGNYKIYEVAVRYRGRTARQGKKLRCRDALRACWCIARYWWKD